MNPLLKDWPQYLTEFLGTLFLLLIIGLGLGSSTPFFALSTGLGLMALTYMGRHLSGAHYNPALTLALLINRYISWQKASLYLLAQLIGAIAGAGLAQLLVQDDAFQFVILPPGSAATAEILLGEALFTLLLVLTYLFLTRSQPHRDQPYYGLGMGGAYFVGLLLTLDLSGAALNPAVAFGPNTLHAAWVPMWYYWVGPLLGASLAALLFRLLSPSDIPPPSRTIKAVAQEVLEEAEGREVPEEEREEAFSEEGQES